MHTAEFACGLNAKVEAVPRGYAYETVLVAGSTPTQALATWGQLMLAFSGKQVVHAPSVLGYGTGLIAACTRQTPVISACTDMGGFYGNSSASYEPILLAINTTLAPACFELGDLCVLTTAFDVSHVTSCSWYVGGPCTDDKIGSSVLVDTVSSWQVSPTVRAVMLTFLSCFMPFRAFRAVLLFWNHCTCRCGYKVA